MDVLTINDRPGHYPKSYYAATANLLAPFPGAAGEIDCDVCIVGAGFTGLSAALHLAQNGYDVVLLEANRVASGASGRNGGQVGTGQRVDQLALERMVGPDLARALWDMSLQSVSLVRALIKTHAIDCGFAPGIIEADHRARAVAHSHAYADHLSKVYDYADIRPLGRAEIRAMVGSDGYFGGTLDMGGGHLHPLNYALGLARAAQIAGVRIHETSRVIRMEKGAKILIQTDAATVRSRYALLAMNGYHNDFAPVLARKVMPINNFIVATEPLSKAAAKNLIRDNHAVADSRFVINYFRLSQDRRMLFGGGESYGYKFPRDIAAKVRKPMLTVYPQLENKRIDYAWGGTLGITMSRMPSFQRLADNVLTAGGFSGHGVAMATLSGKMMADAINGHSKGFDLLSAMPPPNFPGGTLLRWPLLVVAMMWFSLRDKL